MTKKTCTKNSGPQLETLPNSGKNRKKNREFVKVCREQLLRFSFFDTGHFFISMLSGDCGDLLYSVNDKVTVGNSTSSFLLVPRFHTDGVSVAAVSILDKEHCNWATKGHLLARILPRSSF